MNTPLIMSLYGYLNIMYRIFGPFKAIITKYFEEGMFATVIFVDKVNSYSLQWRQDL
jgi:hypothetical protein